MVLRTMLIAVVAVALAGCKPATPVPTAEVMTPTAMPTAVPAALTAQAVVDELKNAGLPVADGTGAMAQDDYGAAPFVCEGVHFLLTDVAGSSDAGGRAFVCRDKADADKLAAYYADLGKASALAFSHVLRNEDAGIVVQLNGDVPKADVELFQAVVDGLE